MNFTMLITLAFLTLIFFELTIKKNNLKNNTKILTVFVVAILLIFEIYNKKILELFTFSITEWPLLIKDKSFEERDVTDIDIDSAVLVPSNIETKIFLYMKQAFNIIVNNDKLYSFNNIFNYNSRFYYTQDKSKSVLNNISKYFIGSLDDSKNVELLLNENNKYGSGSIYTTYNVFNIKLNDNVNKQNDINTCYEFIKDYDFKNFEIDIEGIKNDRDITTTSISNDTKLLYDEDLSKVKYNKLKNSCDLADDYIILAGGYNHTYYSTRDKISHQYNDYSYHDTNYSNKIDVLNVNTLNWKSINFPSGKQKTKVQLVECNNKIFFIGGIEKTSILKDNDMFYTNQISNTVEVYDKSLGNPNNINAYSYFFVPDELALFDSKIEALNDKIVIYGGFKSLELSLDDRMYSKNIFIIDTKLISEFKDRSNTFVKLVDKRAIQVIDITDEKINNFRVLHFNDNLEDEKFRSILCSYNYSQDIINYIFGMKYFIRNDISCKFIYDPYDDANVNPLIDPYREQNISISIKEITDNYNSTNLNILSSPSLQSSIEKRVKDRLSYSLSINFTISNDIDLVNNYNTWLFGDNTSINNLIYYGVTIDHNNSTLLFTRQISGKINRYKETLNVKKGNNNLTILFFIDKVVLYLNEQKLEATLTLQDFSSLEDKFTKNINSKNNNITILNIKYYEYIPNTIELFNDFIYNLNWINEFDQATKQPGTTENKFILCNHQGVANITDQILDLTDDHNIYNLNEVKYSNNDGGSFIGYYTDETNLLKEKRIEYLNISNYNNNLDDCIEDNSLCRDISWQSFFSFSKNDIKNNNLYNANVQDKYLNKNNLSGIIIKNSTISGSLNEIKNIQNNEENIPIDRILNIDNLSKIYIGKYKTDFFSGKICDIEVLSDGSSFLINDSNIFERNNDLKLVKFKNNDRYFKSVLVNIDKIYSEKITEDYTSDKCLNIETSSSKSYVIVPLDNINTLDISFYFYYKPQDTGNSIDRIPLISNDNNFCLFLSHRKQENNDEINLVFETSYKEKSDIIRTKKILAQNDIKIDKNLTPNTWYYLHLYIDQNKLYSLEVDNNINSRLVFDKVFDNNKCKIGQSLEEYDTVKKNFLRKCVDCPNGHKGVYNNYNEFYEKYLTKKDNNNYEQNRKKIKDLFESYSNAYDNNEYIINNIENTTYKKYLEDKKNIYEKYFRKNNRDIDPFAIGIITNNNLHLLLDKNELYECIECSSNETTYGLVGQTRCYSNDFYNKKKFSYNNFDRLINVKRKYNDKDKKTTNFQDNVDNISDYIYDDNDTSLCSTNNFDAKKDARKKVKKKKQGSNENELDENNNPILIDMNPIQYLSRKDCRTLCHLTLPEVCNNFCNNECNKI